MLLRDLAFEESGMKNARTVIEPQRFKWYDIGNTVIGLSLIHISHEGDGTTSPVCYG